MMCPEGGAADSPQRQAERQDADWPHGRAAGIKAV